MRLSGHRFESRNVRTRLQDKKVMLLCPLTYMNQSGKSVRACAAYYDLDNKDILVIHDDLDLAVGRIKVVRNGGAGGHKGVESIIKHLGSREFSRIKIGIGRQRYSETVEDYVLTPFYGDEKDTIEKVFTKATQAFELFVFAGVEQAMNQINCRNLTNREENY